MRVYKENSTEAENYKRVSETGQVGGIGGASVRGWLPPFDWTNVTRGNMLGKG